MKMLTVREVSKTYEISTRMLRYYEQVGLISSVRVENYAYRMYDENAVRRLRLILVMRKLRIPLMQISELLKDNGCSQQSIELLRQNLADLDDEIKGLKTIRSILNTLAEKLAHATSSSSIYDLLEDKELSIFFSELCHTKYELNETDKKNKIETTNKMLKERFDVRIMLLPPCTVASYQYLGERPEEAVGEVMNQFIQNNHIYERKPDARLFGFEYPVASDCSDQHGYEDWLTIPDDMEVPAPLIKKKFPGGLYAVHTIDFPNFVEWDLLRQWVAINDTYCEDDTISKDGTNNKDNTNVTAEESRGCLEEYLNWVYSSYMCWPENGIDGKVDLLLPVRRK